MRLSTTWSTVLMMVRPPGLPTTATNRPPPTYQRTTHPLGDFVCRVRIAPAVGCHQALRLSAGVEVVHIRPANRSPRGPLPPPRLAAGDEAQDDLVDQPFDRREVVGEDLAVVGGWPQLPGLERARRDLLHERFLGQREIVLDIGGGDRLGRTVDQGVAELGYVDEVVPAGAESALKLERTSLWTLN